MKNQTRISLMTFCLIISSLTISSVSFASTENLIYNPEKCLFMNNQFSWNAAPDAVKYTVELTNTSTQQKYDFETTDTSLTFTIVPPGNYSIVVKAIYTDRNAGIVIEDVIII